MIYLIKSASYENNKVFYKIGYTNNITQRMQSYITDNPSIQLLETIVTYGKTKRQLETALHKELKKQGYIFHRGLYNTCTEWFEVDSDTHITLNNFAICKNRKINIY